MSPARERFLRYAAPVLLVIVAALQIYRVKVHDQSPWRGGGFGMYASSDTRFVRVFLLTPDGERRVAAPEAHRRDVAKVLTSPSADALDRLAGRILAELPEAQGVRVELWKARFDSSSTAVRAEKILEVTRRRRAP